MSPDVLRSILDLKSAMMERQSHAVAQIRQELSAREQLAATIEQSIGEGTDAAESGASLQVAIRFKAAQAVRLDRVRYSIREAQQHLDAEQEKLRMALAEKRAVERLTEMAVM